MIYKSDTLDTNNMDTPTAQSMLKVEMEKVQKLLDVILTRRKNIIGAHTYKDGYSGAEKELSDIDAVIINVQRVISELSLMIVSETTTYSISKVELDDNEPTIWDFDFDEIAMRKTRLGKGIPANKIVKVLHSIPKLGDDRENFKQSLANFRGSSKIPD